MQSKLSNAKANEFFDFMVNPPAEIYKNWLPKEHFKFLVVKQSNESPINDLVYYDQSIGNKYRLKFHAIIRIVDKPNNIVFQMRKFGINLPGFLELNFTDTSEELILTETLRIGFNGIGKVCDPFIKIYFNKDFFREMNDHHKREWKNLVEVL